MWKTLDVASLLARREEAITSANAGAFEVPLGAVQTRYPTPQSQDISDIGYDYGTYQSVEDWLLPRKG